jgi:small subunit ribosomal protein S16
MAVAIRFSRQGKKRSPFYRIVAADKRCARDGRFIELLGTYHPITKVLKLDAERYDKWRKVGAQPSGTLAAVIRRFAREAAAQKPGAPGPSVVVASGAKKTT